MYIALISVDVIVAEAYCCHDDNAGYPGILGIMKQNGCLAEFLVTIVAWGLISKRSALLNFR